MLFPAATLARIDSGEVTAALRRWRRPTVRTGGSLTTTVGVLAIDEVRMIDGSDLTDDLARAAGFDDAISALADAALDRDAQLYIIRFHVAGADPRIRLREDDDLSPEDVEQLLTRLRRWDRSSTHGSWTRSFLELIRDNEGVRAGDLAVIAGLETGRFKVDVRKLKGLGLTESLDTGYRISPRGSALLDGADW